MAQLVVNSYNVGTDLQSCILQMSTGGSFPVETLGHLKELQAKGEATPTTISPVIYGGKRLHRNIYHDYSGSLMFERYNGSLVALYNQIATTFQETGMETYFSIYGTVFNNLLNTTDEYLFHQCVIELANFGGFNGQAAVEQGISFRCQTLALVGNSNGP